MGKKQSHHNGVCTIHIPSGIWFYILVCYLLSSHSSSELMLIMDYGLNQKPVFGRTLLFVICIVLTIVKYLNLVSQVCLH